MKRAVDWVVITLVIICFISFIYPYFARHEFEKNVVISVGEAVELTDALDEEGHFYTLIVTGWWNNDNAKFTEEVALISHTEDEMLVMAKKGTILTVGNVSTLKTDIRTSQIEISVKNEEVHSFDLMVDGTFSALEEKITSHAIENVISTAISGELYLGEFAERDPIEERKLNDTLRKDFFYCKNVKIDGKTLFVESLSVKYIEYLKEIYNGNIKGKVTVYVRY